MQDTQLNTSIGSVIRSFRKLKRLNIETLASKLTISRPYLSKIENGHETPSPTLLEKIVQTLNIPADKSLLLHAQIGNNATLGSDPVKNNKGQSIVEIPDGLNILFSNSIFINSDNLGLVFEFAQNTAPLKKHIIVSRIGISNTHAEILLKTLDKHLSKQKIKKTVNKRRSTHHN